MRTRIENQFEPMTSSLGQRSLVRLRTALGTLVALNFAVLWAVPVVVQGQAYRRGLHRVFRPVHRLLDGSPALRRFAAKHIYRRPAHVDYFATAILFAFGFGLSLGGLFALQIVTKSLPWYVVIAYYFIWVGPGARFMAAAYTFAHREGHLPGGRMYRPKIGNRVGNFFENWIGPWYGTIPYNFSTSHLFLHHRLNGGKGDPIYVWDIDRTNFWDVMRYQWRVFRYMTGISSLKEFRCQRGVLRAADRARRTLIKGMVIYWILLPAAILTLLTATGSSLFSALLFLFFIYFQPLCAMSCFLSLLNLGWHGFLEFDEAGRHVKHVTSGTILDGPDDSYGEDFHVAHHHFPSIGHDRLTEHVEAERQEWGRCHGSVFENTTILELSVLVILGRFDILIGNHYVDCSQGSLSRDELVDLFERRAQRKEMSYEEYEFGYLPRLRESAGELVSSGVCDSENGAYVYQAHRNLQRNLKVPADQSV